MLLIILVYLSFSIIPPDLFVNMHLKSFLLYIFLYILTYFLSCSMITIHIYIMSVFLFYHLLTKLTKRKGLTYI